MCVLCDEKGAKILTIHRTKFLWKNLLFSVVILFKMISIKIFTLIQDFISKND